MLEDRAGFPRDASTRGNRAEARYDGRRKIRAAKVRKHFLRPSIALTYGISSRKRRRKLTRRNKRYLSSCFVVLILCTPKNCTYHACTLFLFALLCYACNGYDHARPVPDLCKCTETVRSWVTRILPILGYIYII